ncbi:transposase [Streptomyces sp. NPDC005525]|uniref:transposase n=1 Tax=Streptomyces sp. NPDC005525 TaxID=3364720 RepID=UPI00369CEC6A
MAARLGEDGNRQALANFITTSPWDPAHIRAKLAWRMEEAIGPDAFVFDDTGFLKDGTAADETREQVTRLTAVLDELGRAAEKVRITRKTLLELPGPAPPAPSPSTPELPDGAAYQEIMVVFTQADGPLRARGVCEAMDLDPAPNNINNVRLKLKRLAGRNILAETEPGLFALPRP